MTKLFTPFKVLFKKEQTLAEKMGQFYFHSFFCGYKRSLIILGILLEEKCFLEFIYLYESNFFIQFDKKIFKNANAKRQLICTFFCFSH